MSWLQSARDAIVRYGTATRFVVRQVIANAFPGGALAADLVDRVLDCAQNSAEKHQSAELRAMIQASDEELRKVELILQETTGRLGTICDQVAALEGMPDAANRIIRIALSTQEEVRAGFANVGMLSGRLDRIEEQQRQILDKLAYGADMKELLLQVLQRNNMMMEFIEEWRTTNISPKQLSERFSEFLECLTAIRQGQADTILPRLEAIEQRQNSAAVWQALASGAAVLGQMEKVDRYLVQAAKLRPHDADLIQLSRRVTQVTQMPATPPAIAGTGTSLKIGDTLDGWKLVQQLGEGGWGQVYRAEGPKKTCALKILHVELSKDSTFEAAFRKEIVTLVSLGKQPHIVSFDDFGFAKNWGCWYFTMDLIEGESLQTRLMRKGKLERREALQLFSKVAGEGGLATVHSKGIVHRDIKPANILLKKDDVPVLVDFGVAGSANPTVSTKTRASGHTAMFASTEQLRGKNVDFRSDVFSLTASLFYALTLLDPDDFDPDQLPPDLHDLRSFFEMGMHKRPDKRPENGLQLAKILQSYCSSNSTSTNFIFTTSSTTTSATSTTSTKKSLPDLEVITEAKPSLQRQPKRKPYPNLPPGYSIGGSATLRSNLGTPHSNGMNAVAFSPDGKCLASASEDQSIVLWSVADSSSLRQLTGHGYAVNAVAFSPDGKLLASGSTEWTARIWDVAEGKCLKVLSGHNHRVYAVAFSPDGSVLATGSGDNTVRLWNVAKGTLMYILQGSKGHKNQINALAFNPEGTLLASASHDRTIRLWKMPFEKGKAPEVVFERFTTETNYIKAVAFSPNGQLLASGEESGNVCLWDVSERKLIVAMSDHNYPVNAVAFSPDGKYLASGSTEWAARLWDVSQRKCTAILTGHSWRVYGVAFSPDGQLLATAGGEMNNGLRVWLLHSPGETIDWSISTPAHAPKARCIVDVAGDGVVYAGDILWVKISLENAGAGEMVRVRACLRFRSDLSCLKGLQTVVGKIKPGEKIERCLAVILPADIAPQVIHGELIIEEGNQAAPPSRSLSVEIRTLPRQDFLVHWHLTNAEADTPVSKEATQVYYLSPGDNVDVVVKCQNFTGRDWENIIVKLKPVRITEGVRVADSPWFLGNIADGQTVTGSANFVVDASAKPGVCKLELRIESKEGCTLAIFLVDTYVVSKDS